jgi:magnesium chelatase subunit I
VRGAAAAAAAESESAASEYRPILEWFSSGNHVVISDDTPHAEYLKQLSAVRTLPQLAAKYLEPRNPEEAAVAMELALEGLHQNSMLSRDRTDDARTEYKDMLKSMLSGLGED